MKTHTIVFALVAIAIALPTAEAAWKVETKHNYKYDKTETYLIQTDTDVLQESHSTPANQNYRLEIHSICAKYNRRPKIVAEYVNLNADPKLGGNLNRATGWYRFGKSRPREMLMTDKSDVGPFILLIDPDLLEGDIVKGRQGAFNEKMETSQEVILGIPYYEGEVVLRFDLIGFSAALAQAKNNCE